MSDQHYATPEANLTEGTGSHADLMEPLLATRPWVKLCSILGFIATGFILLGALGMLIGGSMFAGGIAGDSSAGGLSAAPMGFLGVIYLIMAVFYFVPSLFLFKYASAISVAAASQSARDIGEALKMQKSFWKFVGIVALIMLIFMILGIGSAVLIPLMM